MTLVRDGFVIILTPLVLGVFILFLEIGGRTGSIAGVLLVILALFFAYFFRDPNREIIKNDSQIISPADGTVLEVVDENGNKVVRIFLSIFNVHLQRSPVKGTIKSVQFNPGKFLKAYHPDAHSQNQNNIITIGTAKGDFIVKQISGILARRVISWVKPGDNVEQGEKIGFIRFGSQVDVYIPCESETNIKKGDKVVAGRTVLCNLKK
ncbi:phosphatidylserine decarboxylase [Elusimicrobiota bacterium]